VCVRVQGPNIGIRRGPERIDVRMDIEDTGRDRVTRHIDALGSFAPWYVRSYPRDLVAHDPHVHLCVDPICWVDDMSTF